MKVFIQDVKIGKGDPYADKIYNSYNQRTIIS